MDMIPLRSYLTLLPRKVRILPLQNARKFTLRARHNFVALAAAATATLALGAKPLTVAIAQLLVQAILGHLLLQVRRLRL